MAARDEAHRKADARAFTDQVDALVSATLRGEPTPAASEDAIRLAGAFVLLDRLVSQYVVLSGPAIATGEGAVEAQRMLLSLRSGYSHPAWTYIDGVRTKYRLNRKAPIGEQRRRAYAVGCLTAMRKIDARITDRAAAKALADRDYFRQHGVTVAMLRKWPGQLAEPPALDLADQWQRELIANARTADDAMRMTVTALQGLETADRVPSLTAAARRRPMFARVADKSGQIVSEIEVGPKK